MWRACGHCSQCLCLCTLQSWLFFWGAILCLKTTLSQHWCILIDTQRWHLTPWQVAWMVIWPGAGLLPANWPWSQSRSYYCHCWAVTRHPELSISHAKYTRGPSLQQPPKQADHCPVLSCHTVARHISSLLPDLGLEIPRIKIHFRLHFLFNNHQVQTKLETTFNKNSNYSTLGRADMITT